MPIFGGHVGNFPEHALAGIVHQDVECSELAVHGMEEVPHLRKIGDIRGMPEHPPERTHRGSRHSGGFRGSSANGNRSPLGEKPFGDSAADAACTAGHNCNFVLQCLHA